MQRFESPGRTRCRPSVVTVHVARTIAHMPVIETRPQAHAPDRRSGVSSHALRHQRHAGRRSLGRRGSVPATSLNSPPDRPRPSGVQPARAALRPHGVPPPCRAFSSASSDPFSTFAANGAPSQGISCRRRSIDVVGAYDAVSAESRRRALSASSPQRRRRTPPNRISSERTSVRRISRWRIKGNARMFAARCPADAVCGGPAAASGGSSATRGPVCSGGYGVSQWQLRATAPWRGCPRRRGARGATASAIPRD